MIWREVVVVWMFVVWLSSGFCDTPVIFMCSSNQLTVLLLRSQVAETDGRQSSDCKKWSYVRNTLTCLHLATQNSLELWRQVYLHSWLRVRYSVPSVGCWLNIPLPSTHQFASFLSCLVEYPSFFRISFVVIVKSAVFIAICLENDYYQLIFQLSHKIGPSYQLRIC
jgi:hypothetical protein